MIIGNIPTIIDMIAINDLYLVTGLSLLKVEAAFKVVLIFKFLGSGTFNFLMSEFSDQIKDDQDSIRNDYKPELSGFTIHDNDDLQFGHNCECIAKECVSPSDV